MVGELFQGIGSLVGAAGQIGLGAKQISADNKRFQEQLQWEREQYERDLQNSWDMFNATNSWNSEQAQAARKKLAGINPQLDGLNASTASQASLPSGSSYGNAYNRPTPNYMEMGNNIMQAMTSLGSLASMYEDLRSKRLDNDAKEFASFNDILSQTIGDEEILKIQENLNKFHPQGLTTEDINGAVRDALKDTDDYDIKDGGTLKAAVLDTPYANVLAKKLLALNPYNRNKHRQRRFLSYAMRQFQSDYLASQVSGHSKTKRENRNESMRLDSQYGYRENKPYGYSPEVYDMTKMLYELEKTRISSEKQSFITNESQKTIEANKRQMMLDLTNQAKKLMKSKNTMDKIGGYFLMSLAIMVDSGQLGIKK